MMVLPLVEKGALADLIVTEVIKGIEYAWIVCSAALACNAMSSPYFTPRPLGLAALYRIFTCGSPRFTMVTFIW